MIQREPPRGTPSCFCSDVWLDNFNSSLIQMHEKSQNGKKILKLTEPCGKLDSLHESHASLGRVNLILLFHWVEEKWHLWQNKGEWEEFGKG
ncbi:hypothetical protein VNO77_18308 [Canavalia gladiata]|uniref:Uncharacterized protein n=1 Tax=Canavalia gladiata TaxID=3824 RepID=A0AAN9LKK7_CANGL